MRSFLILDFSRIFKHFQVPAVIKVKNPLKLITMEATTYYFNEFEPICVSVNRVIDYNRLYLGL